MKIFQPYKTTFVIFTLIFATQALSAHTINYALEGKPFGYVFSYYLKLGFEHIIPQGFDHILFIVGLYLMSPKLKDILLQATAFTVAHTLTLMLSMKSIIVAPPAVVEPIIALSICFVALENIFITELKTWRIALVFAFGLVHGMGFAASLNEIGLPPGAFFSSLITFNVGVELGQISIILLCYVAFGRWFSEKTWYRKKLVIPMSVGIALIAGFWTVQRLFF